MDMDMFDARPTRGSWLSFSLIFFQIKLNFVKMTLAGFGWFCDYKPQKQGSCNLHLYQLQRHLASPLFYDSISEQRIALLAKQPSGNRESRAGPSSAPLYLFLRKFPPQRISVKLL